MATTTGVLVATDRRHPSTARETARWSARAPELGARRRATSRAWRCGSGRVGKRLLEDRLEEVTEGGVGEACLRLDRTA